MKRLYRCDYQSKNLSQLFFRRCVACFSLKRFAFRDQSSDCHQDDAFLICRHWIRFDYNNNNSSKREKLTSLDKTTREKIVSIFQNECPRTEQEDIGRGVDRSMRFTG